LLTKLHNIALLQKQRVWKRSASVGKENSVFLRANVKMKYAVWCGKAGTKSPNF